MPEFFKTELRMYAKWILTEDLFEIKFNKGDPTFRYYMI